MTSVATPPVPLMLPPGLVPYRLTVDQYEAMVDAGILTEHDRLELIEGMLVKKMTKKPDHSAGSEKGRRTIDRASPRAGTPAMSSPSASRRGTASPNRTSPWSGATSRITSRATPAPPTPP